MAHVEDERADPSTAFEESDVLSPGEQEPEPEPGLNGTPVHCEWSWKNCILMLQFFMAWQGMMCVTSIYASRSKFGLRVVEG